jgi:hypothetical protein
MVYKTRKYGIIDLSKQTKVVKMKGSIRAFLGFMIVFGTMGSLDANPEQNVFTLVLLSLAGLGIMFSGVMAMKKVY